jgi:hypothetical protein
MVWLWSVSPKGSCIDDFIPGWWHYWEVTGSWGQSWSYHIISWSYHNHNQWINPLMSLQLNGPLGGGDQWKKVNRWGCLWRVYLIPGPSLSLHVSLLPGHHEVNSFALPCPSTMMFCITTGPNTTEPADHGLKPLKSWAKINLSSLYFWQIFCHNNEKLTNTYSPWANTYNPLAIFIGKILVEYSHALFLFTCLLWAE